VNIFAGHGKSAATVGQARAAIEIPGGEAAGCLRTRPRGRHVLHKDSCQWPAGSAGRQMLCFLATTKHGWMDAGASSCKDRSSLWRRFKSIAPAALPPLGWYVLHNHLVTMRRYPPDWRALDFERGHSPVVPGCARAFKYAPIHWLQGRTCIRNSLNRAGHKTVPARKELA